MLVSVVFLLDGGFQFLHSPQTFWLTFWIRLSVIVGCVGVFVLARVLRTDRFTYGLGLLLIVAVAVDVERAVLVTGGLESPYYVGLLLLLVSVGLLAPLGSGAMAVIAALIWAIFLSPLVIDPPATLGSDFSVQVFFLGAATIVALVTSHATARLRRREFIGRRALQEEQAKSERLLLDILPKPIAERLKAKHQYIADGYAEATVLFADITDFTAMSESLTPQEVVACLNRVFTAFDRLADRFGLEKIKTIGDAYMVAGGLPEPRADHAEAVADMALEMIATLEPLEFGPGQPVQMRIGINSGPVVAGVIGTRKFIYDLWGDTVNTASRMESHGISGAIQLSTATYEKLKDDYVIEKRGIIEVKGKGEMVTYLLKGRR